MKKKGFTLIEMLGVFTLLALILLISIPSLTGMLKKQKENEYQGYLNDLYLATEAYVQNNDYDLSQPNQTLYIKLETIVSSGFLRSTIINPKTNEKVNLEHYIKLVVNEDNTFYYEYLEETPDLTTLAIPTWGTKTATTSNITVTYTLTDDISLVKETICYYGETKASLLNLGTSQNSTCIYPTIAAYAKVCAVSNSGIYSCSEIKQLVD